MRDLRLFSATALTMLKAMTLKYIATLVLARSARALVCSTYKTPETCSGCVSSGECVWQEMKTGEIMDESEYRRKLEGEGSCVADADSPNCGPIGITAVDGVDEVAGACSEDGGYPYFCTEDEANAASPDGTSHEHHGYWMPLGVTMYHGDFDGVAPACECEGAHHGGAADGDHDESEEAHDDHDGHDHGEEAESDAAAAARLLGAAALAAAGVVALA